MAATRGGARDLTVRQLIARQGGGRGHRMFAGTPEQAADTIQEWFESGAADGFNVMPAHCRPGWRRSPST
jgi:alkanesulfonate monooxygenase SsuD/methylene tetrahydromethanopterin reductase-like flavin-dependent oxidoreductase (luciferase family)